MIWNCENEATVVICSYCIYLKQQVRVEGEESQPNTEDTHTTEEQNQSPSSPNRRAPSTFQNPSPPKREAPSSLQCPSPPQRRASSSLLENLLGNTFPGATAEQPISAYAKAEEVLSKFCGAPPIPLSEDPLSWWRKNEGNVSPALQVGQVTILLYSSNQCLCRKSLLYCRGYCDCPTEYTHTRACQPAPVLT